MGQHEDFKSFKPGMRVDYIPAYAHGDIRHPGCERGTVTSQNGIYVFVRFDSDVHHCGEFASPKGCTPRDLTIRLSTEPEERVKPIQWSNPSFDPMKGCELAIPGSTEPYPVTIHKGKKAGQGNG